MPKEVVHRATPNDRFEVEVGWSQDREVQLGVVGCQGKSLNWFLHVTSDDSESEQKRLQTLGQQFIEVLKENESIDLEQNMLSGPLPYLEFGKAILNTLDVHGSYRGVFSDLSREGCNDLIRILRRARDSAYGRDE